MALQPWVQCGSLASFAKKAASAICTALTVCLGTQLSHKCNSNPEILVGGYGHFSDTVRVHVDTLDQLSTAV